MDVKVNMGGTIFVSAEAVLGQIKTDLKSQQFWLGQESLSRINVNLEICVGRGPKALQWKPLRSASLLPSVLG